MNTNEPICDSAAFEQASHLLGDFWTLRITDVLRDGELRFCEIERAIPTISPATLTGRLKKLEDAEVVQRNVETRDRQSVSYELTGKGQGIVPVLDAIRNFTQTHVAQADTINV